MKKQLKTDLYGVIGLGRFGTALVQTLAEAGKEVIAIDKNEEKVKAVRRYTDYAFVVDNLSEDALKETGMQNCGTVTVCIGEQVDISILTTMLVIKLGVPQAPGCHGGLPGGRHGRAHRQAADLGQSFGLHRSG